VKSAALVFAGLVLVAACSGGAGTSQPPSQSPSQPPSQQPSQPAGATAMPSEAAGVAISVAQSSLGAHLAGPNGHALYVLTNDSANTSTCSDSCAQNWPPLLVGPGQTATAGDGVTGAIATFSRADGGSQVSINGMPVYYFAGDSAASDTNGQGIGGVWFLAAPDGSPLGAASTAAPSASAAGYQRSYKPY
jgi:predicted lipoprotein with Yx(FWY)xxD motif